MVWGSIPSTTTMCLYVVKFEKMIEVMFACVNIVRLFAC